MPSLGQTLADAFAAYDPQRNARLQPRKPTNEDFWRQRLAWQGSISRPERTIGDTLAEALSAGARKAGVSERTAHRVAKRATNFLNDATPVGNATGAEEGGKQFTRGLTRGDLKQAAVGAGIFGLSVLPYASKATKPVRNSLLDLLADENGAIRAWHGSPHDFDKFSMDKIGTGEGAQAYGHGLYFAENKKVASDYRNTLAMPKIDGRDMRFNESAAWGELNAAGGDIEAALANSERQIAAELSAGLHPSDFEHLADKRGTLRAWQKHGLPNVTDNGRLYEVNINAEPEDFLDWDAPLASQPNAMRALQALDLSALPQGNRTRVLLERAGTAAEQAHYPATGRELLNAVSGYGENRAGSGGDILGLQPFGIKGLQYLDQGSRGASQGTRNFVIPDASLIDILAKY